MERILGIDFGTRRVGVAVADTETALSTPLKVIDRKKSGDIFAELRVLCEEEQVTRLAVGLPVNMNGTEGSMAEAARKFAARLSEETGLPVSLVNETLSSAAAREMLIEAGVPRKKWADKLDAMAAAEILRCYLKSYRKLRRQ